MSETVDKRHIFSESQCLSLAMLQKYQQKELSADQVQQVERHLVDCELCTEALDGIAVVKDQQEFEAALTDLKETIKAKAGVHRRKIIPLGLRMVAAAAAVILLLAGSVFVFKYLLKDTGNNVVTEKRKDNRTKQEQVGSYSEKPVASPITLSVTTILSSSTTGFSE